MPETAHIRSDALRILTTATIMMGFGLFGASFQRAGPPDTVMVGLWLTVGLVAHGLFNYLMILSRVSPLLVRDDLRGQDLEPPFYWLNMLFLAVSALLVINLLDRLVLALS